jgi:hypothetical protein
MAAVIYRIRYVGSLLVLALSAAIATPLSATGPAYQLSVKTVNGERVYVQEHGEVPDGVIVIETYSKRRVHTSSQSGKTTVRIAFDALVRSGLPDEQRSGMSGTRMHARGSGPSRNAAIVHALMRAAQQHQSSVSVSSSSAVVGSHSRVVHEISVRAHALVHNWVTTVSRERDGTWSVALTVTLSRLGR